MFLDISSARSSTMSTIHPIGEGSGSNGLGYVSAGAVNIGDPTPRAEARGRGENELEIRIEFGYAVCPLTVPANVNQWGSTSAFFFKTTAYCTDTPDHSSVGAAKAQRHALSNQIHEIGYTERKGRNVWRGRFSVSRGQESGQS
jgi:hypothetical protein